MCFFFSLFPATMLAVVGFFVLFTASKAEGGVRVFGKILCTWIFVIALLIPTMGALVTLSGLCPLEQVMAQIQTVGN